MTQADSNHRNNSSELLPIKHIKSYIAYDLILNAIHRLQHNYFAPAMGYIQYEDQLKTYNSYWQSKLTKIDAPEMEEFCISPSYLCMNLIHPSDPFEPYENNWTPMGEMMKHHAQQTLKNLISTRRSHGNAFSLNKLYYFFWREFSKAVSQNFRREGLQNYYHSRSLYASKYADLFTDRIREIIFGRLYVEHKNQDSLDSFIAILEHINAAYLPSVHDHFIKRKKGLEIYTDHCHAKISLFLGKHQSTFWFIHNSKGKQKMEKVLVRMITEYWYSKWELQALGFALKLIPELKVQIKNLQQEFQACYNNLSEVACALDSQKDVVGNILAEEYGNCEHESRPHSLLYGVNKYLRLLKSDKSKYNGLLDPLLKSLDQGIRQNAYSTLDDKLMTLGESIANELYDELTPQLEALINE